MSLKERRELAALYGRNGTGVLFTLVAVRGSSYRQPGARLFVDATGSSAGTLSGGCLEADLLQRAAWYVRDGARVQTFTTAFDDTADIPYGLGCGGEVDVLAEESASSEGQALLQAVEASGRGEHRTIVTLLPHATQVLQRFVMDERMDVLFASDSLDTEDLVPMRRAALRSSHGATHSVAQGTIFVEELEPVQRLVIFGAGDDARPLASMAHTMGWRVAVVDTRSQRLTEDRFPLAEERIVAHDAAMVRSNDAVVVMTHSYEQDRHLVAQLLANPPRFTGLLGARHRSALLLQEASAVAGVSMATAVAAVHAPVGLLLGGDGPEAIALAIVAEIQSVLARRPEVKARRMTPEQAGDALASGPAMPMDLACRINGRVAEVLR